jgi:hypothetical protein
LGQPTINRLKRRAVELYRDTYEEIKHNLLHGKLIHTDETHVSEKGKSSYVWVFTSVFEVIYIWSETRQGSVAGNLLREFKGVLVTDFYSAYDSIDCPQQRCLIHLIRDLNKDVLQEPFNEEFKEIVRKFTMLLRPMIETIDRFGLKTHFLRKHKAEVSRFFDSTIGGNTKRNRLSGLKRDSGRTEKGYLHFLITTMSRGITITPNMRSRLLQAYAT